jgi:hypothetical protein
LNTVLLSHIDASHCRLLRSACYQIIPVCF